MVSHICWIGAMLSTSWQPSIIADRLLFVQQHFFRNITMCPLPAAVDSSRYLVIRSLSMSGIPGRTQWYTDDIFKMSFHAQLVCRIVLKHVAWWKLDNRSSKLGLNWPCTPHNNKKHIRYLSKNSISIPKYKNMDETGFQTTKANDYTIQYESNLDTITHLSVFFPFVRFSQKTTRCSPQKK